MNRLPLTLDFSDLSVQEKVGHLERKLTRERMPADYDPSISDLSYYASWGNVVLYYGDVGNWEGIVRTGTIHGDRSVISDQAEHGSATLDKAR